jgi:hypothetical protein
MKKDGLKILIFDIETAPMLAYVWDLWDQNVGLNQIKQDWHILSWSAKWLQSEDRKIVYGPHTKTMYMDQSREKNLTDDSNILKGIWNLLDEADIVITQNGVKFDSKKLNARFVMNGMQPPSSYRHIDTFQIAKRYFCFTSNKLEYMSDKLCVKYKKQTKRKYSGFELWKECLAGNKDAWREMQKYNKYDVLSLEELYHKLIPWDSTINFDVYREDLEVICKCGCKEFRKRGYFFTPTGKFQRYKCLKCGSETRSRKNLLSKEKNATIRVKTPRT